jgi:DNA-binding CsgD family transcriptional regulator
MSTSRRTQSELVRSPPPSDLVRIVWRTAFDGLFVVDDSRRYLHLNEPAARLLGAPAEQIVNRRIEDFTPSELWPVLRRLWSEFEERGAAHGRYEILRGDRSRALVEIRATRDFGPGEHLIAARNVASPPRSSAEVRLTPREREILQLAANGRRTREIAALLTVSSGTVKTHFEHAYEKLGVHDRASAVAFCLRRGLID